MDFGKEKRSRQAKWVRAACWSIKMMLHTQGC